MNKKIQIIISILAIMIIGITSLNHSQESVLLVLYGEVFQPDGVTHIVEQYPVIIYNLSKSDTARTTIGALETGKYEAAFVDFYNNAAVSVGDSIRIVIDSLGGGILVSPPEYEVKASDITNKRIKYSFRIVDEIAIDLSVQAPPAQPGIPGQDDTFTFNVINTGDVEDNYNINVMQTYSEWSCMYPNLVGPVKIGDTVFVDVIVHVPDSISEPTNNYITLHACSYMDPQMCAKDHTYEVIATALQNSSIVYKNYFVEIYWQLYMDVAIDKLSIWKRGKDEEHYKKIEDTEIERIGNARYICRDHDVSSGLRYEYQIGISNEQGVLYIEIGSIEIPPIDLMLYQNHPNPFNPATTIRYYLPQASRVNLQIYDISGRRVIDLVDKIQSKGFHTADWDGFDEHGNSVASGVYFYKLKVGKKTISRKMVLLK